MYVSSLVELCEAYSQILMWWRCVVVVVQLVCVFMALQSLRCLALNRPIWISSRSTYLLSHRVMILVS